MSGLNTDSQTEKAPAQCDVTRDQWSLTMYKYYLNSLPKQLVTALPIALTINLAPCVPPGK